MQTRFDFSPRDRRVRILVVLTKPLVEKRR